MDSAVSRPCAYVLPSQSAQFNILLPPADSLVDGVSCRSTEPSKPACAYTETTSQPYIVNDTSRRATVEWRFTNPYPTGLGYPGKLLRKQNSVRMGMVEFLRLPGQSKGVNVWTELVVFTTRNSNHGDCLGGGFCSLCKRLGDCAYSNCEA